MARVGNALPTSRCQSCSGSLFRMAFSYSGGWRRASWSAWARSTSQCGLRKVAMSSRSCVMRCGVRNRRGCWAGAGMVDRAQARVVGLGDAEVPLDVLKVFVGGDRSGGVEDVRGDAGADHVDPVEGGLGGDLLLVAAPGEGGAGDLGDEVLADLVLADHLPDPYPDLVRVLQPAGGHRRPDLGEVGLGGGEQVLALAGPLGLQHTVVAADQPFAGVAGVGDLGEVTDAGQAHLQRAVI